MDSTWYSCRQTGFPLTFCQLACGMPADPWLLQSVHACDSAAVLNVLLKPAEQVAAQQPGGAGGNTINSGYRPRTNNYRTSIAVRSCSVVDRYTAGTAILTSDLRKPWRQYPDGLRWLQIERKARSGKVLCTLLFQRI
jgi:hypothetical protein